MVKIWKYLDLTASPSMRRKLITHSHYQSTDFEIEKQINIILQFACRWTILVVYIIIYMINKALRTSCTKWKLRTVMWGQSIGLRSRCEFLHWCWNRSVHVRFAVRSTHDMILIKYIIWSKTLQFIS